MCSLTYSFVAQASEYSQKFEVAASIWNTRLDASIDAPDLPDFRVDLQQINDNTNAELSLLWQHNIWYIPDVLLSYTSLKHDAVASLLARGEELGRVADEVNLSNWDINLFYTPWRNMVDVSIGLSYRQSDGKFFDNAVVESLFRIDSLSSNSEMLFLQLNLPIDSVGLDVTWRGQYGKTDRIKSIDWRLYASYLIFPDCQLRLGYRVLEAEITTKAFKNFVYTEADVNGAFFSVVYQL